MMPTWRSLSKISRGKAQRELFYCHKLHSTFELFVIHRPGSKNCFNRQSIERQTASGKGAWLFIDAQGDNNYLMM
jgi:hypothetical protein